MIIVFGQAGKQQRWDNKSRANFKHWYSPATFNERVESKNGRERVKGQLFFKPIFWYIARTIYLVIAMHGACLDYGF